MFQACRPPRRFCRRCGLGLGLSPTAPPPIPATWRNAAARAGLSPSAALAGFGAAAGATGRAEAAFHQPAAPARVTAARGTAARPPVRKQKSGAAGIAFVLLIVLAGAVAAFVGVTRSHSISEENSPATATESEPTSYPPVNWDEIRRKLNADVQSRPLMTDPAQPNGVTAPSFTSPSVMRKLVPSPPYIPPPPYMPPAPYTPPQRINAPSVPSSPSDRPWYPIPGTNGGWRQNSDGTPYYEQSTTNNHN